MVDRGGLNYPIRVRDEFSKTTRKFRAELSASKKAFRDFQRAVGGGKSAAKGAKNQAKELRDQAKAQSNVTKAKKDTLKSQKPLTAAEASAAKKRKREDARAAKAAKKRKNLAQQRHQDNIRETKALKSQARELDALARAQRARERTSVALRNKAGADVRREKARVKTAERQAKADRRAAQAKDADFQATKRNNAALFREKVIRAQIAQLQTRGKRQFMKGDFVGGTETLKRARDMERSLGRQVGFAQKLLFTFRRLVGVLAIFTLFRQSLELFKNLVTTGIKFNDTVAIAQLGIAGLVVTLGDVRDAFGQSVSSTEELNLALGVAREQTAKLRQDSLKTVATFEQLLDTFQVSVGPGLAAGLNLDEVRELTVDISQAASALGVPQNQLAEEVRSLLSGTIQARTTRIATALGISNEDIRRLKEAGTLFDFLEDKFKGFGEAAELTARTTFKGIQTLIKGLVQEILGNAAKPLFDELVSLGNDLFDNFLAIRDAAGNIKPSPEVVAAFQQVFDSIKRSIEAFRNLGTGTGIQTLDSVMAGIAITIDFISGAVTQLVALFASVGGAVKAFAEFLGISSENAGAITRFTGKWLVNILLIKKAIKIISIDMAKMALKMAPALAAFFGIAKAVEFVLEAIFGIDLGIRDTIQLIAIGLQGAWIMVSAVVRSVASSIVTGLSVALKKIVNATKKAAAKGKGFIDALFGDSDEEQQAAAAKRIAEEKRNEEDLNEIRKAGAASLAKIKADAAADQLDAEQKIAKIIGDRAGENAKGEGFREGFDPTKTAADAAKAAQIFVSTAQRPISDLGEALAGINNELRSSVILFEQAQRSAGVGGLSGQLESVFNAEEIASAERLRKIETAKAETERQIARLRIAANVPIERELEIKKALLTNIEDRKKAVADLNLQESEGGFVSALRDQILLVIAINAAEEEGLRLATLKAATIAAQSLPALREEAALLGAQLAAERATTAAVAARVSDRDLALVASQNAVDLAERELAIAVKRNLAELDSLLLEASVVTDDKELRDINAVIDALDKRRTLEADILRTRLLQLEAAQKEAELVANGSMTEGLMRGFNQFAQEFSSTFNAGIEIARAAVDGLAQFASQAIVDAFDPTKEVDIVERFARLMQQIAQVILTQLIQLAIAKAIIKKATGEEDGQNESSVSGATAVGAIRISTEASIAAIKISTAIALAALGGSGFSKGGLVQGFAKGGMIPSHYSKQAQGLARGGRPAHIPLSDTVPAWLTPGEFVMNKASTSQFLPQLQAMNGGSMSVVGSSSAEAAGPTAGMAHGGVVQQGAGADAGGGEPQTIVVPAIVAREGEMDRLTAGGKNAMLSFMRDNAGNISSILDRSNRQG